MRKLPVVLVLIVAAAPLAAAEAGLVPCSDGGKCPDLIVDQARLAIGTQRTENFGPNSCAVQEGMVAPGARQVLRFTFNTPNIGAGDLIIGAPADHPEWFEFHPCHDHFHFKEYADYRLWAPADFETWQDLRAVDPERPAAEVLAEHPELQPVVGAKRGFCVIDISPGVPPVVGDFSPIPKYTSCDDDQGISRGWADEYLFTLDGQWVDVTNVATGVYVLEAEVNAEHFYVEEKYGNNWSSLEVVVT